jgi:hypothetical protein
LFNLTKTRRQAVPAIRMLVCPLSMRSRALVVDPYDDASRSFYRHFGFRDIPGSTSMFVKLM